MLHKRLVFLMQKEMTYAVSSHAGPWACFGLTVQPFRVLAHLFLMLFCSSCKNLVGGMWIIGKSSFTQRSFPTKMAGTASTVLLALGVVATDHCTRYCIDREA